MKDAVRMTVILSADDHAGLKELAEARRVAVGPLVRMLIGDALDEHREKLARVQAKEKPPKPEKKVGFEALKPIAQMTLILDHEHLSHMSARLLKEVTGFTQAELAEGRRRAARMSPEQLEAMRKDYEVACRKNDAERAGVAFDPEDEEWVE